VDTISLIEIEEGSFEAVEATLAAIALATRVALVLAAAPAGIISHAGLVLAALLVDAASCPALGISADAVMNHRESALASCTLTTRVVLVFATAPASILAIALLVQASF